MTPDQVTAEMVQQLRDNIDEQDDAAPYTDDQLKLKIADANGVGAASYYIWVNKAAALSTLVDISEGGSTRKNSQAYTAAASMVEHFKGYVPTDTGVIAGRTSRTRAIVRP